MKHLALLLSVLLPGGALASGPDQALTVEFYDIGGNNWREIRQQLDRRGPIDQFGSRYDGLTQWNIRWSFRTRPTRAGCRLAGFDTELATTITMPRWQNPGGVPARLVEQWGDYVTALRLHEDGHHQIGVEAAAAIDRLGDEPRTAPDCAQLGQELNAAGQAVLAEYNRIELEYDKTTQHGATQGARTPAR